MQGAGAPLRRDPSSREMGALGRSGVIRLTYVLVTLALTCLFMRFSIMPVSARARSLAPSRPHCTPRLPAVRRQGLGGGAPTTRSGTG